MLLKLTRRKFITQSVGICLAGTTVMPGCSLLAKTPKIPKMAIKQGFQRNEFGAQSTAEEVTMGQDLSGKIILVTGANSGLGYETMRVLALRGAHVLAAARTKNKAHKAANSVVGKVTPIVCELTDFESIVDCATLVEKICADKPLDALVCNAGIMGGDELQTVNGLEKQFVVNYLGHFLLTQRLLALLKTAPQARVVMVSSGLYTKAPKVGIEFDNLSGIKSYDRFAAYGQSKLAMALFVAEFSRRFSGTTITANALYPGVIHTNLFRDLPWYMRLGITLGGWAFMKTVAQGAATQCYVASHPALANITGLLFADCNPVEFEGPHLSDLKLSKKLWEVSMTLTDKHLI